MIIMMIFYLNEIIELVIPDLPILWISVGYKCYMLTFDS